MHIIQWLLPLAAG
ncbi:hypothetical protein YPPY61_3675, partial [Yersinia pestis PY-61]